MRKFTYILVVVMALLLTGCGQASGVEAPAAFETAVIGNVQTALPDMGQLHLQSEVVPGDEYAVGWCTTAGADENAGDEYTAGAAEVAEQTLPVKIKLRGNSSKEVAKKAYTIKFEEEVSLLGMEPGKKWALVSDPFDKTLLRPAVGFSYAQALGIDYTPDFRLCKVWLNDEYMGVYTAMEPIEAGEGRVEIKVAEGDLTADAGEGSGQYDFLLERNLGRFEDDKMYIDSSLGMRFEFNEPEEPGAEQVEQCREMLAAAEEAICSGEYQRYSQLIDVDSFVNFYIFHELVKDIDFGEYSTRYYFQDGILHAGPPWDLDLTMGNVSTEKEEFKYAAYNNVDGAGDAVSQLFVSDGVQKSPQDMGNSACGLWAATGDYYYWLCRDPQFMELVQQRWIAVREVTENLAVDNELGTNLIDRYLATYEENLAGNFSDVGFEDSCWSVNEPAHMSEWQYPADTYAENVELLRTWLIKRAAYLDTQFGIFAFTPALAVQ